MTEFRMPSLGADMDAGTLVEWKVKPGDRVRRGDIVAVVETQKGAIDVEIFQGGTIERLVVPVGVKVPVDTVLALLRADGEPTLPPPPDPAPSATQTHPPPPSPPPSPSAASTGPLPPPAPPAPSATQAHPPPAAAPPEAAAEPSPPLPSAPPPSLRAEGPPASPRARRLAHELGVDLLPLRGTGPHGAITGDDVQRAAEAARRPSPHEAMRAAIAAAMTRSKRTIPHYYLGHTVDLTPALAWMSAQNLQRPVKERLLPAALILKAIARALRKVPELSGFHDGEAFHPSAAIHLGVAISLRGGGLIAPALHDAADLPLGALMEALRDLTTRARAGALRSSELADPTITVTSLGDQGVDAVYGVITPPQVALVGVGTPALRPWVVDGAVVPRTLVRLTLAADHRVSDGHRGAVFLAAVDRLLQEPENL